MHTVIYDNYFGASPTINHNMTQIDGNCDFLIIQSLPESLKPGDKICLSCLDLFKDKGLIKHDSFEPKIRETICDICLRDCNLDITTWAIFMTPSTFSYGLSGSYQTKNPVEFKSTRTKDWIVCSTYLENIPYDPLNIVECDLCHEKFQAEFNDSKCSSSVTERGIYCHYGSRFWNHV